MNTPIVDFVRKYAESYSIRLHMPGHKGNEYIGPEKLSDRMDILISKLAK